MMEDRGLKTEAGGRRSEAGGQLTMGGKQRFSCRRVPSAVCLLFSAVVLVLLAGCGKKSDPFIPQQQAVNVKVDQLHGLWKDRSLALKGVIQGG